MNFLKKFSLTIFLLLLFYFRLVKVKLARAETQDLPDNYVEALVLSTSDNEALVDNTSDNIEDYLDTGDSIVQDSVTGIDEAIDDTLSDADHAIEGVEDIVDVIDDGIDNILERVDKRINNIFKIFDIFPDFGKVLAKIKEVVSIGSLDNGESISIGATGIPNPEQIWQKINQGETKALEELLATYQADDSGSPLIKDDAKLLYNVELGQEVAETSALGETAQRRIKSGSQLATQAIEESANLAEDSEGQDVTQKIMRNISIQNAVNQQTDTQLVKDALLRQRDDAIRNVLTADAVQQLQRDRTAARRTDAAAFNKAILQGAQLGLPSILSGDDNDDNGD